MNWSNDYVLVLSKVNRALVCWARSMRCDLPQVHMVAAHEVKKLHAKFGSSGFYFPGYIVAEADREGTLVLLSESRLLDLNGGGAI